jgi:phosphoribosylamine--glycine ligase
VIASEGYPSDPVLGKPIGGLEEAAKTRGVEIFHSGTRREGENYYTSGGRVMAIGAVGSTLEAAHRAAYEAAGRIRIPGAHYRRDIGIVRMKGMAAAEIRNK